MNEAGLASVASNKTALERIPDVIREIRDGAAQTLMAARTKADTLLGCQPVEGGKEELGEGSCVMSAIEMEVVELKSTLAALDHEVCRLTAV